MTTLQTTLDSFFSKRVAPTHGKGKGNIASIVAVVNAQQGNKRKREIPKPIGKDICHYDWSRVLFSVILPLNYTFHRNTTFEELFQDSSGHVYATLDEAQLVLNSREIISLEELVPFNMPECLYEEMHYLTNSVLEASSVAWNLVGDYESRRRRMSAFPTPFIESGKQRGCTFVELHRRFWLRGLFSIAEQRNIHTKYNDFMFANPWELNWHDIVSLCDFSETDKKGLWRYLWVTACELLEWYLSQGALLFEPQISTDQVALAGQRGNEREILRERCSLPEQRRTEEIDTLLDILHSWMVLSRNAPKDSYLGVGHKTFNFASLESYVYKRLGGRLKYLQSLGNQECKEFQKFQLLPECRMLRVVLRYPQTDRLPHGFYWRRQVREKFGEHYGMQDMFFHSINSNNTRRYRSYLEIEKELKRY